MHGGDRLPMTGSHGVRKLWPIAEDAESTASSRLKSAHLWSAAIEQRVLQFPRLLV